MGVTLVRLRVLGLEGEDSLPSTEGFGVSQSQMELSSAFFL